MSKILHVRELRNLALSHGKDMSITEALAFYEAGWRFGMPLPSDMAMKAVKHQRDRNMYISERNSEHVQFMLDLLKQSANSPGVRDMQDQIRYHLGM